MSSRDVIDDPAYVSGRFYAVLEDLYGAAGRTAAGFTGRHLACAVACPLAAVLVGRESARAWLHRLRRDRPRRAEAYERRLDDLLRRLNAAGGVPVRAGTGQQVAFLRGYHDQRVALSTGPFRSPGRPPTRRRH